MKLLSKAKNYFVDRQLLLLVILAVVVATITTTVSLKLYNMSDVSRLDLSLPGHEKSRESIGEEKQVTFDANGPLNLESLKDFQQLFDEKRASLNALHRYDGDLLEGSSVKSATEL